MNFLARFGANRVSPCPKRRRSRSGLTLVEIAITLSITITILLSFSQALTMSMLTSQSNREAAVATDAARQMMESLQASDFATLFAANNSVVGDDPAGETVRLASFAVAGLTPQQDDADGLCGEILMPELAAGGASELREDVQDFALNMPRDLNGDGLVDALDHSDDYQILPVIVRIEWRGAAGPGRVQFKTILSNL